MPVKVGVNFISTNNWQEYQIPAFSLMKPDLAKFNMFYDHNWQVPAFGKKHLDQVIGWGARTIIIRTAETKISPDEVFHQLEMASLPDSNSALDVTLGDYFRSHPDIEFWVEVGNEPDLHGQTIEVHRWALLETAKREIPQFKQRYPNVKWMASMPTHQGANGISGADWFNGLVAKVDGVSILDVYDGFGVHTYGYNTLARSDGNSPWTPIDWMRGYTPKPLWITEAGINSGDPWWRKAELFNEVLPAYPPQVKGVTYFTLSLDPQWYSVTKYSIDVSPAGVIDGSFAGSKKIGTGPRESVITPGVPKGWHLEESAAWRNKGAFPQHSLSGSFGSSSVPKIGYWGLSGSFLNVWFEDVGLKQFDLNAAAGRPAGNIATAEAVVHERRLKYFMFVGGNLHIFDTGYEYAP